MSAHRSDTFATDATAPVKVTFEKLMVGRCVIAVGSSGVGGSHCKWLWFSAEKCSLAGGLVLTDVDPTSVLSPLEETHGLCTQTEHAECVITPHPFCFFTPTEKLYLFNIAFFFLIRYVEYLSRLNNSCRWMSESHLPLNSSSSVFTSSSSRQRVSKEKREMWYFFVKIWGRPVVESGGGGCILLNKSQWRC